MADESRTAVPTVRIGLLGPVRAAVDGHAVDLGGGRQRALLAALAVDVGRTVSTGALIDAVWDGDPPDAADRTFRTYVARLRRAFDRVGADGAAVVVTAAAGYRLDDAIVTTDVQAFEGEVAGARARLSAGEAAAASEQLRAALDRWEGRALGEFADRPWAAPSSTRLEEARRAARELLVRALLDAGRIDAAVTLVEQLAAAEPLRDSVARLRALALYRTGRDADALQGLREFRERLVEEHGLDPSPRLGELESMILERDPRLDRAVGGRRLRGYVLHEPIAHSALGTVHRAEQPSIGREVAVTVLPADVADDADVVRTFETRVQAVAGLDHPHVLPVYDYWREPGGAYVVTRFPSGGTLAQQLRTGGLDAPRTLQLGQQIAAALAAAHDAGVVHGGLNADAIVVDDRGDAFVWSFPVAAASHPRDDVAALATLITTTMTGGEAGGGVATAVLPEPAATTVRNALDPLGGSAVTAASLAAAFDAALRGDRGERPIPVEAGPNPYRGLAAFREVDHDVFFGRDALVEQVRARLARLRAVAVVGPSGAGKSSAVRAGVLPALRTSGDFVTTMLPGTRPLAELEVALARVAARELDGVADEVASAPEGLRHVIDRVLPAPDGDLVLVVDQFEEFFTLSAVAERDLFLTALRAVVEDPNARAKVLVTLRADFLGQVLSHPVAGPLVRDRAVMVGPLTDDELHEAVTRPAEVAGVAVEPALATAVVADAARFPGSLPMVQFALTEVFEAADDGTMTLAAYRRIGGIEGVLGQRAEEVFQRLDDGAQRAVSTMFQRLVVPHDDGPPARRRALRHEFGHVPDDVIDAFGRARLLRFDHDEESREPTVEVTHEALFRAWPRLVAWIEEGEDDLRLLGHLTVSASDWDAGGRREADLYRGHRLDAALAFAADRREELSDTERAYLDASTARRARDAEADRRAVRRLRVLTGGLAVGLVLALIAGTLAFTGQRREADLRRDAELAQADAEQAQTAAEAAAQREASTRADAQADALAFAATVAVEQDDVTLGALLAAEAYAAAPDVESQGAMLDVLGVDPRLTLVFDTPSSLCSEASGDAQEVAIPIATEDGPVIEVHNLEGEVVDTAPWRLRLARCVTLSPTTDHFIHVLNRGLEVDDRQTGEVVAARDDLHFVDSPLNFALHPTAPEVLLLRDDGTLEFASLPSLEARVTGEVGLSLGIGDPGRSSVVPAAVGYSEDGSLAFAAEQGALHVLDSDDGRLVGTYDIETVLPGAFRGFYPFVSAAAGVVGYLEEDRLVVTDIGGEGVQRAIDLGATVTPYGRGIAVEPGGRRVAAATEDGIALVDLEQGVLVGQPLPADTTVIDVRWTGPGEVLGLGPNGVVRFDVDRLLTYGSLVRDEAFPPGELFVADDGTGVVVDGREQLFVDMRTGDTFAINDQAAQAPAWAKPLADGRWIWVRRDTGVVRIGDVGGVRVERQLPVGYDVPSLLDIAPAGDRVGISIASVEGNAAGFVLDGATGDVLLSFESDPPDDQLRGVYPLGDDLTLVRTASGTMTVHDADGQVIDEPRVVGVPNGNVAGSPDGRRYVSADFDGTLNVVDRTTGSMTELVGAFAAPASVSFVDDNRIVSHHGNGVTYLWDVSLGRRVGELASIPAALPATIAIDRNTGELLQPVESGLARLPLQPDTWLEAVCNRVTRPLTDTELEAVVTGLSVLDPCGVRSESAT